MTAPVYVMPPPLTVYGPTEAAPNELAELLRQLITIQQEQVSLLKTQQANQDGASRWRAFLTRWETEFPGLAISCKQVIPAVERAYLTLVRDVAEKIAEDPDALTDEFQLSEFLDRYGTRLGQMGNLMGQIAPLADAAPPPT